MSKILNQIGGSTVAVDLSSIVELTDERMFELSRTNRDLRLGRTAELIIQ